MTAPTLILASSSPARAKLLRQLGLSFTILSPDIDESPQAQETPAALALRLAEAKALAIAKQNTSAIIIAADSLGTLAGKVLTKPLTHANAVQQLAACSGKVMTFYTGLCVYDPARSHCLTHLSALEVHFKPLTPAMIEGYLHRDQPYACAGSIKLEALGISLIRKIIGDDYTAIIGLPLMQLSTFLQDVGLDPLHYQ